MTNGLTVAVLGTGIMGGPMARSIAAAGHSVRVWNRTTDKAQALAGDRVEVADSPADAARGADLVVTMLANAQATEAVADSHEQAFVPAMSEGTPWIQMGTVGLSGTERLAALARSGSVAFIDAPVLGTRGPATDGELVVLGSGPDEVRKQCDPVFEAVGRKTLWLGEAGQGSALKLVVNTWVVGLVAVLSETVALAEGLDLDPRDFLSLIEGGPLDAGYAQTKGAAMAARDFDLAFPLQHAAKDARLALEAANREGLVQHVTRAVAEALERGVDAGHGEQDMAAVVRSAAERRPEAEPHSG
ncbi:MAG: NAD(P)-dependent oxidoreductase [Solirubrobacterales bacterium]